MKSQSEDQRTTPASSTADSQPQAEAVETGAEIESPHPARAAPARGNGRPLQYLLPTTRVAQTEFRDYNSGAGIESIHKRSQGGPCLAGRRNGTDSWMAELTDAGNPRRHCIVWGSGSSIQPWKAGARAKATSASFHPGSRGFFAAMRFLKKRAGVTRPKHPYWSRFLTVLWHSRDRSSSIRAAPRSRGFRFRRRRDQSRLFREPAAG